ncbi:hypothetical protein AVEN_180042-1, partial [Araneus ventricosus]
MEYNHHMSATPAFRSIQGNLNGRHRDVYKKTEGEVIMTITGPDLTPPARGTPCHRSR